MHYFMWQYLTERKYNDMYVFDSIVSGKYIRILSCHNRSETVIDIYMEVHFIIIVQCIVKLFVV